MLVGSALYRRPAWQQLRHMRLGRESGKFQRSRDEGVKGVKEAENEPTPYRWLIGNREVVGHGMNGNPCYIDEAAFPFPAIRYRECDPELMAIQEKERGDWRKLSVAEKKYLYRASFRQTFAEMHAPSSEWKCILGCVLAGMSLASWMFLFIHHKVNIEFPQSFSAESRIAQYYRQVEINNQPFSGNYRPPGAEPRVHPKNERMLREMELAKKAAAEMGETAR